MNNGIRSTAARFVRRLQYSIDRFFADNKYFRVKGHWFCHWGIAGNDLLSLAYCVQATLGAFPSYLSARTGQATLLINLPDYRRAPLALSHRRLALAPAPLGGEPEPLQPLGHTSDKHKLGRGRGWLIWGISRHEEVRFAANFGFKKTNCLLFLQKNK